MESASCSVTKAAIAAIASLQSGFGAVHVGLIKYYVHPWVPKDGLDMVVFTKTVTTSQLNLNVEENMPRHVVKGVLIFEVLNRIIRSVIIQFEPETRIRTSLMMRKS